MHPSTTEDGDEECLPNTQLIVTDLLILRKKNTKTQKQKANGIHPNIAFIHSVSSLVVRIKKILYI